MPILNWLGRDEALKIAAKTPYKLLEEVSELGYGDKNTENMIIQGDNLEALKALLPFYAGQVKCIYIDPPYNTGSAFEHYDDNLEHSQWLSLMYPRLEILRDFLTEDGSIWISIDDDEGHYLKVICDEVFGRKNFVNNIVWEKKYSPQNDARWFSDNHDHILCYAKNKELWHPNLLTRTDEMNARYKNPDNDPRGNWKTSDLSAKRMTPKDIYEIITPSGRKVMPPKGRSWAVSKDKFQQLVQENRVWFGSKGDSVPQLKRFLSDVQNGTVSLTIWKYSEVGHNQDAKKEVKAFNLTDVFETPKPERLIERVLTLATNNGDLVLDSFLGSGTTAAVAHKMGRRYIGIEMGEHAKTHCVPRLKAVIDGEQGGISKSVNWNGGGGFRFYKLGSEIFDADGFINENISFENLSAHIWFTETKTPFNKPAKKSTYLGTHEDTAYALLYNGVLRDKRVDGGNVLTNKTLQVILDDMNNEPYEKLVIYGESSRISANRLKELHIEFKQTPYDIKAR